MSISTHNHHNDDQFDNLVHVCQANFDAVLKDHGPHLFTVDAGDLFATYLNSFPEELRQHHTCHCCRRFIEQYGNVVAITTDGQLVPAFWPIASLVPDMYHNAVQALYRQVSRGKVTGVFLAKEKTWGTPEAGGWSHFAVVPPRALLHTDRVYTPFQRMAAKREDFGTLNRALAEFKREHIAQALTLLEADALYRAEKVIGPAHWLMQLHDVRKDCHRSARDNLTWLAVACAPVGFCTPRSSMVGTLLEDIAAGMDFAAVKKRFDAKMHPLQYQRPQAPASAGNIAQAEKIVEQLGITPSLERRYARLEDVQTIWEPTVEEKPSAKAGVFGHLKAKGEEAPEALKVPPQDITFDKFRRTVLPNAKKIEFLLTTDMNFCGMLTAVHADAPPIIQWDNEEQRNPVSWYVWSGGSTPSQWGLRAGTYVDVTGVTLQPSMWGDEERFAHQGKSVIFLLEGAKETRSPSLGLFPEILKSELHQVRATIESFSRAGEPADADLGSANGIRIGDSRKHGRNVVRVTSSLGVVHYNIDRWD